MYIIQNINMKHYLISLVFGHLLFQASMAQGTMNLDNILKKIDSANAVARMYDAQIRSSDAAAKGSYVWESPQVGGGFWMVPYDPKYIYTKNGETGMGQFMLSVQQMFPNKVKQNARYNYLKAVSSVDMEKKKVALNELYGAAKKSFYQWLVSKKKLSIISESENVLKFMLKSAEISYKNNVGNLNAYYKAEAALGNLKNLRLIIEKDIAQSQISLNTLMNRYRLEPFDIDTSYILKIPVLSSHDIDHQIAERSDIRALDKETELTQFQEGVERASLLPELSVRFDHMFGLAGLPMQYNLQAMVTVPLARSSRAAKANVESLQFKSEAIVEQKKEVINELSGMVSNTQSDIEFKKKQMALFQQNIIPSLRKNFQVIQLGYQQNTGQLFELYDAWESLNKAQLDYTDLIKESLVLQVELEKLLQIK